MSEEVASALLATLISANVSDSNGESANLVDTTNNIAKALWAIADALKELSKQQTGEL